MIKFAAAHHRLLCCTLSLSLLLLAACRKDKEEGTSVMMTDKGTISGTISPVGQANTVQALSTDHFSYSAMVDAAGAFKFSNLPAGTYSVWILANAGFTARAGVSVTVIAGQGVNMGALLVYPANGSNSLNYLSYEVNSSAGVLKSATSCSYAGTNLTISAQSTALRPVGLDSFFSNVVIDQLDIILDNVNGIGTYTCKGTSSSTIRLSHRQTSPFGDSPLYTWSTIYTGGSGTVQITAIDLVNRTIAGTFSATAVPEYNGATGNKVIANGVFANVAY